MQSPEEDAFWTFISLMDTHLRSYFSSTAIQLEVDGSLFGKALESNEPALAKKVFVDMALSPVTICRPWYVLSYALAEIVADAIPTGSLRCLWTSSRPSTFIASGTFSCLKVNIIVSPPFLVSFAT